MGDAASGAPHGAERTASPPRAISESQIAWGTAGGSPTLSPWGCSPRQAPLTRPSPRASIFGLGARCQYLLVTLNDESLESVKTYWFPRERRLLRPSAPFRKALSDATVPFGDPVA